jgi:release factor glutamine methyltransferase
MNDAKAGENGEWTFARLLAWTGEYLARQGLEDARLCGEVLLAHAAGCGRIDLYVRHDQVPPAEVTGRFRELVKRAAGREPIAYLVGEKEFYSLCFAVDSAVLIPRPETETLVDVVLDHCRSLDREAADREAAELESTDRRGAESDPAHISGPGILDVGTGSGCISVTLLKHLSGATVVATDVSEAALKISELNGARHGVLERMTLVGGAGLDLPAGVVPEGGFDVIVSNPPYVSAAEMATLDETVRAFEPRAALTDGGDGLSVYRAIAAGASRILKADGIVAVEIAMGAGEAVKGLMIGCGLTHRTTVRDRVGGHERVMVFAPN